MQAVSSLTLVFQVAVRGARSATCRVQGEPAVPRGRRPARQPVRPVAGAPARGQRPDQAPQLGWPGHPADPVPPLARSYGQRWGLLVAVLPRGYRTSCRHTAAACCIEESTLLLLAETLTEVLVYSSEGGALFGGPQHRRSVCLRPQKARSQLQCLPTPVKSTLHGGQVRGDCLH